MPLIPIVSTGRWGLWSTSTPMEKRQVISGTLQQAFEEFAQHCLDADPDQTGQFQANGVQVYVRDEDVPELPARIYKLTFVTRLALGSVKEIA